jgi:ADP-heptose:LPS heptosyltransferase
MTRILVVQLCRLGDILQTTPMLRGLRRAHPRASITLLVLDGFRHAPVPTYLYDELAVFPFDRVAASVGGHATDWPEGMRLARECVASLGREPFDLVLNLTGSALANLLCALVPSREVRGGLIAPDRTRVVRHPWMAYFWSSLLAREFGCVNLVDLFCRAAEVPIDGCGLELELPAAAEARIGQWLASRGWAGGPLIALQLGASDERKRWPPERFAEMANRLPERAGTVVLVGSEGERPLGVRAASRLTRRHVDAMGETSVVELAALLARCSILVTNDTGTMHVAAAVGTPVLDLSTGPVFVHETGPYAVGSIAVEPAIECFPCAAGAVCHHLSCREDFTPDDIAALAMFVLEGGAVPRPARARVLQASRAGSGRLEFRPLWDPRNTGRERVRQAFGRMWEATLGHRAPEPAAAGRDAPIGCDGGAPIAALDAFASRASATATLAARISATRPAEAARHAGEIEHRLAHEITASAMEPLLGPLVAYLRTRLESLTDRRVDALAAAYRAEWRDAASRARMLAAWLSGSADAQASSERQAS